MKKILSLTLVLIMMCTALIIPANAAGLSDLFKTTYTDNETWKSSSLTDFFEKEYKFTPKETGYYSINYSASVKSGDISDGEFMIYILDDKDSEYEDPYSGYFITKNALTSGDNLSNVYLIKGHKYSVLVLFVPAEKTTFGIEITFKPMTYTPVKVSSKNKTIPVSYNAVEWFEYTASKTGDYSIKLTPLHENRLEIYTFDGKLIADLYDYNLKSIRLRLEGGKKYIMKYTPGQFEESNPVFSISVKKCSKNIKKISIDSATETIWIGSIIDSPSFKYKIIYSDGSSEVVKYDKTDYSINASYAGKQISDEDIFDYYYATGKQKIRIDYMMTCTDYDYTNIIGAVDMVASKKAIKENQKKTIKVKSDDWGDYIFSYAEGLYKIKVTDSNYYTVSFGDDGNVYGEINIYENKKILKFDESCGGYKLKAGKEYCAEIIAYPDDEGAKSLEFSIVPVADHTHKYSAKTVVDTKATTKKDGKTAKVCADCGHKEYTKTEKITSVKLPAVKYIYDGKAKTPTVTVKDSAGKTLKSGTDYSVKYSGNKNIGTAKAVITFKGKYSGTKTLSFKIVPEKVSGVKITKASKGVKLSWSAVKGATGYEVYSATSKSGKYSKIGSTTKLSFNAKNGKSNSTVYYKIRAYKTVEKTKYYSAFSSVKSYKF